MFQANLLYAKVAMKVSKKIKKEVKRNKEIISVYAETKKLKRTQTPTQKSSTNPK